jgi:hypothetical protein
MPGKLLAWRFIRLPTAMPSYDLSYSSRKITLSIDTIVGRGVSIVAVVIVSMAVAVCFVVRVLVAVFVIAVGICSTTYSII